MTEIRCGQPIASENITMKADPSCLEGQWVPSAVCPFRVEEKAPSEIRRGNLDGLLPRGAPPRQAAN